MWTARGESRTTIGPVAGNQVRFLLALASTALVGAAVVLWFGGDWRFVCPETHATGFMDCGGQPDAVLRSELPEWVSLRVLTGTLVAGALGLAVAVVGELRSRRPSR